MATVLDIIKRALRQLKVLPAGQDPTGNEAADALVALQGLYDHLTATDTFGPLTNVLTSGVYVAGENERVTGASSVTLPTTIVDATTGETRSPKDRAVVVVAGATPVTHLYDADLASWVSIRALTLTSEAPLSSRYSEGLAAMLALFVADEYAAQPSQITADAARRGKRAMTRKDAFEAPPVAYALLRTSNRMRYEVEP
jgi:hypothetical protein